MPARKSKIPITNASILRSPYFKTNRGEDLLNKYSGQSGNPRSINSLPKSKKKTPFEEKKESMAEFSARFEKKIFCNLSAKEIEAIMIENRRMIENRH